jgi:ATP-dependent Lon protease
MVTAIASRDPPTRQAQVGMTGEVTLQGRVPSLAEAKVLAAHAATTGDYLA